MGFFSRIVKAVSSVADAVVSTVNRALGVEPKKAPATKAGPLPTVVDEEAAKPKRPRAKKPSAPKATPAPEPTPSGAPARAKLASELGPVDATEDTERSIEEIELDQWLHFFEEHADDLPEGFLDELRAMGEDYDLDDELFTTTEMDAPKGDTP